MTNSEAIGYAIMALKRLGYNEEQIRKIEGKMLYMMDMYSEEEAEDFYRKF